MLKIKGIRKRSIKAKLVIDFGVILIGICIFSYFFISCVYQRILNERQQDKIKVVTNAATTQIQLVIRNSLMILGNVENFNSLSNEELSVEEKVKRLNGYTSPFDDIAILDTNGIGVSINNHTLDMSSQVDFEEALLEKKDKVSILKYEGQVYLVFFNPVLDEVGNVRCVLLGVRPIESIFKQILQASSSTVCFIANKEGQMIYDVAENNNINTMHIIDNEMINLFKANPVSNKEYIKVIKDKKTKELLEVRYSLIGDTKWILGTVNSKAQVQSDVEALKKAMIIGMSLMICIGLILVYISANTMSKRMQGMIDYLERNIKNEFKDSISNELLENDDEIGTLAKELKNLEGEMQETLETIKESMDYINNLNEKMKYNNKK
ncbi:cache domain-containing protein [Cellulosilyticum ruminicola]|uniref:cache domain-containing protein n=1 Tax=Cellulosilyticum ruminicola TaxID=425254 RepID=UPI0006D08A4C|nr:cache domain-containing protein [Cellulosilyticum ruminicola]